MQSMNIPHGNEAFDRLLKNVNRYVAEKTSGTIPEWTHIPRIDIACLAQAYVDWYSEYVRSLSPHPSPSTKEMCQCRMLAERALNDFISRYLCFYPVTDIDRENMGIPKDVHYRIPRFGATEVVELELKLQNIKRILSDFLNRGSMVKTSKTGTGL